MLAAQPSKPIAEAGASVLALGKTFCATQAVLIAGLSVLLLATDGGQSFTTETLRRSQVSQKPRRIESFEMLIQTGEKTSLHDILINKRSDDKSDEKTGNKNGNTVWIVDFVYTRCLTLCSSLGSIYQQLQAQIESRGLQGKVGLLSISFDPTHDDAAALKAYATRMQMNPAVWQIATLSHWQDRRRLLDAFGIMIVPAPLGEFEHNAALHLLTSDGSLVQIIDYADFQSALDIAAAIALPLPPAASQTSDVAR